MKTPFAYAALMTAALSCTVRAADVSESANRATAPAVHSIYKEVMPDGRVIYSDRLRAGAKIERTIRVDVPVKERVWSAVPGSVDTPPLGTQRTTIVKTHKPSMEAVETEVIRTEMLLEDAKKRKLAGAEPRPGERVASATGEYRFNDAYVVRQYNLANDVIKAEDAVLRAVKARNALR